jgi:hypothetical protein
MWTVVAMVRKLSVEAKTATVLVYGESGELGAELEGCLKEAGVRMTCAATESEVAEAFPRPEIKAAIVMLRQGVAGAQNALRRTSAVQSLGALRVFEKPIRSDELLGFMDDFFPRRESAPQE